MWWVTLREWASDLGKLAFFFGALWLFFWISARTGCLTTP